MAAKCNIAGREYKKFDEVFTAVQTHEYSNLLKSLLGDLIFNYLPTYKGVHYNLIDLQDSTVVEELYTRINNFLNNIVLVSYNPKESYKDEDFPTILPPNKIKQISAKTREELLYLLDNFDLFKEYHLRNSGIFNIKTLPNLDQLDAVVIEQEDTETKLEEGTNENSWATEEDIQSEEEFDEEINNTSVRQMADKSANGYDPYLSTQKHIKLLFKFLIQTKYQVNTKSIVPVLTSKKLPQTLNEKDAYNLFIKYFNNIKSETELLDKLNDPNLNQILPFLAQIRNHLRINDPVNQSDADRRTLVELMLLVAKPEVRSEVLIAYQNKFGDTSEFISNPVSGNKRKILNKWISNFEIVSTKNRNILGKRYLTKEEISGKITSASAYRILKSIGIEFSENIIKTHPDRTKIEKYIVAATETIQKSLLYVFSLNDGLKDSNNELILDVIQTPLEDLQTYFYNNEFVNTGNWKQYKLIKNKLPKNLGKIINDLVELEGNFSSLIPSNSGRTATGELVYNLSDETNITVGLNSLQKAKTEEELLNSAIFSGLSKNPYYKASAYRKFLFKNGVKIPTHNLELSYLSGYETNINGVKKRLIRKLSEKEKLIHDFKQMIKFGKTDVMRLETSNTYPAISMKSSSSLNFMGTDVHHFFAPELFFNNFFESPTVQEQFLDYLNSEIEKINSYPTLKKKYPFISNMFGEFLIFSDLDADLITKLKQQKEPLLSSNKLFKQVLNNYERLLNNKLQDFKATLKAENISFYELIPQNFDTDLNPYNENKTLDYNKADMLLRHFIMNTLVQNIEFTIYFTGDPSLFEQKGLSELAKRLKGLSSTGSYTNVSSITNRLVDNSTWFRGGSSLTGIRQQDKSKNKKRVGNISRASKEFRSLVVEDVLYSGRFDPYKDKTSEKVTDGQGYISLDTLYELSIRQGWLNEYNEVVFKYESLIFKREFTNLELSPAELQQITTLEKLIYSDPNKYSLPVMKAGYWGNIINTDIDGKMYDKFSLMPLLPSVVHNQPKLKQLLLDSIDNNIDYIKHPSGTKAFVNKVHKLNEVVKADPDLLHKELFKLQLNYSNESSTDTAIPTQLLKLIYSNEFDKGQAKTEEIKVLYNNYLNTLNAIQKENINNLFADLGIEFLEEGDGLYKFKKNIFINRLYKEAKRKDLDINVLNAIKYSPELDSFSLPIEQFGYITDIYNLLSGIIDKNLRRFRVAGGDYVLISNGLSKPLRFYREEDGKILKAEARITLNGEFIKLLNLTHPDGKPIENIYRLNKLLENPKWVKEHEQSLTIVVDRVPTQELNSMDVLIITEFLSPTMGTVIQMPDEIIIKAGLDFDYDKEKVLLPSFDKKGNYIVNNRTRLELNNRLVFLEQKKQEIFFNNKLTLKQLKDQFLETTQKLLNNIKIEYSEFNDLMQNIHILKHEINHTTNEMFSLLKEINEDSKEAGDSEIRSTETIEKTVFGNVIKVDVNSDDLAQAYLTQQSQQVERLANLNQLYQEKKAFLNQIQAYHKQYEIEFKEFNSYKSNLTQQLSEIEDEITDLYRIRYNFFSGLSNEIVMNYSESLLRPDRFKDLIKPNSAAYIKKIAKEVSEVTKNINELPNRSEIFDYLSQLKVFSIFNTAKNMLGPYAKINTTEKLLNYSNINFNYRIIDKTYTRFRGKRQLGRSYTANHLLLTEAEQKINVTDGKTNISSKYSVDGRMIQDNNSQSINATVDAAKDPFFINLMISYANVGVDILFTSIFKYPYERVKYFLSHPMNLAYAKSKNQGLSEAEALVEIANKMGLETITIIPDVSVSLQDLNNIKLVNPKDLKLNKKTNKFEGKNVRVYTSINKAEARRVIYGKAGFRDTLILINNGFVPTTKSSKFYIRGKHIGQYIKQDAIEDQNIWKELANPKNIIGSQESDFSDNELINYNLRAFANFFAATKLNKAFANLRTYLSFDTNKLEGPFGIIKRRKLREDIIRSMLISEEDLFKLENSSILSAFKNEDVAEQIYTEFSPIINNHLPQLYEIFEEYNEQFIDKNTKSTRSLPNKIKKEFLYSIIYNFGNKAKLGEGIILGLEEGFISNFVELRDDPQTEFLFQEYPVLNQLILKLTTLRTSGDPLLLTNLQFIKNFSLSSLERNMYIEQFTDLVNTKEFVKDPEVNQKIINFVEDLTNIALAQSGFQENVLSFREFIPNEVFKQDFEQAFNTFQNLDSNQKYFYLEDFKTKFKNNNKHFFPTKVDNGAFTTLDYRNPFMNLLLDYDIPLSTEIAERLNIADELKFERALRVPPIKQNFRDSLGRRMQPQFTGKTTMQLVLSGDRTRTTRSTSWVNWAMKQYGLSSIYDLTGQIVRMTDDNGNWAFTEITGVYELTQAYQDISWQKEGWEKEVTDRLVGDYPVAIEFKVVDRPIAYSTLTNDGLTTDNQVIKNTYKPPVVIGTKPPLKKWNPNVAANQFAKDQLMWNNSTKSIMESMTGAENSSTRGYAEQSADIGILNTSYYNNTDVIMISVEGKRAWETVEGAMEFLDKNTNYKKEIKLAATAKATFLLNIAGEDNPNNYNTGDIAIKKLFLDKLVEAGLYSFTTHSLNSDIGVYQPLEIITEESISPEETIEFTPETISSQEDIGEGNILVFSSNDRGNHGKGLALLAKEQFKAKNKQAQGLQGNSFAIITRLYQDDKLTDYSNLTDENKVKLEGLMKKGFEDLVNLALTTPDIKYYVPMIGTGLAGISLAEMKSFFTNLSSELTLPSNIILPEAYEYRNINIIHQLTNKKIKFNKQQTKVLSEIGHLITKPRGIYLLAGYAGTGKTTLIEPIAKFAKLKGKETIAISLSNRAVKVISQKAKDTETKITTSTIHKLLFGAPNELTGEWVPADLSKIINKVIIIDEVSMVNQYLTNTILDKLALNNTIIFMGDSYQLEEPDGENNNVFKTLYDPTIFETTYKIPIDGSIELTEVMRVGLDSNVLKLATLARMDNQAYIPSKSLKNFTIQKSYKQFLDSFTQAIANEEDTVMIVATNKERIAVNEAARTVKFGKQKKALVIGDKIISVANSLTGGFANGDVFSLPNIDSISKKQTLTLEIDNKIKNLDYHIVEFQNIENPNITNKMLFFPNLDMPSLYQPQIVKALSKDQLDELIDKGWITENRNKFSLDKSVVIGTYGYAITAHKSQGSQYNKVFVNQNFVADNWNRGRWLYTAMTRSSKDVILFPTSYQTSITPETILSKLNLELPKNVVQEEYIIELAGQNQIITIDESNNIFFKDTKKLITDPNLINSIRLKVEYSKEILKIADYQDQNYYVLSDNTILMMNNDIVEEISDLSEEDLNNILDLAVLAKSC